MKVSLSKSAIEDLIAIKAYYLEQGVPRIGQNFVAEIVEHIESLSTNPDIGRVVPEFSDTSIRELIHPPFRIIYLRDNKLIKIVRVWRSERLIKLPR